jgi:hypothetical protein
MYFLVLEAYPKPSHPEYGSVDGAYASCFVNAESANAAEADARFLLDKIGWDVERIEEAARQIERTELRGNGVGLERYDQALTDSIVVTLHEFPVGAPDEE